MRNKIYNSLLIVLVLTIVSCNSSHDSSYGGGTQSYEDNVLTVEQQEIQNPLRFLTADGTYRKNLANIWVLEGSIKSSATVATYKDVVVKISFYSKTKSLMGIEQFVVYEYVSPSSSKSFKVKSKSYRNASSVGWEVVGVK